MNKNLPIALVAAVVTLLSTAERSDAQTFLVDFGSSNSTYGDDQLNTWNTIPNSTAFLDGAVASLTSTTGFEFIGLEMVRRFNGENLNGTLDPAPFPTTATQDSLFGNTESFGIGPNIRPAFSLTGLDPTKKYNLTFYASRVATGTDIRTTEYVVTGSISGSAVLSVRNNVSDVATVFGAAPTPENELLVELFPAANNNNGNHFTYLGVMKIEVVPEPTSALMIASGVGILMLRRRRSA